jgi:SAM-dependent methyltransferase
LAARSSGKDNHDVSFETGTEVYARHVGRFAAPLAAAFCDAVSLRQGDTALDVGCGAGALAAELGRRLGPGSVAGVEPSAPFLEAAREAVPRADLRSGRAEALPFGDGSFDVALSQLVVNFMQDAPRGVAELARVARRTVASCVWDYAGEMTMLRVFWDAALELDHDAPDEGRVMAHSTPEELHELWEAAGLREVETGELVVAADYADFEDYWSPFTQGLAPSGAYCASLPEDRRVALRDACYRRLGSPGGAFSLRARAWCVVGTVRD